MPGEAFSAGQCRFMFWLDMRTLVEFWNLSLVRLGKARVPKRSRWPATPAKVMQAITNCAHGWRFELSSVALRYNIGMNNRVNVAIKKSYRFRDKNVLKFMLFGRHGRRPFLQALEDEL